MYPGSINMKRCWPLAAGLMAAVTFAGSPAQAQFRRPLFRPAPAAKSAPASAHLTYDAWKNTAVNRVPPGEIDQMLGQHLQSANIPLAPLTTDEQFIRRVSFDLTGKLPLPDEVKKFVADRNSDKRAKLIDQLLVSLEYARRWATYWRDVIAAKVVDRRGYLAARAFERWLSEELGKNTSWAELAKTMITSEGQVRFTKPNENGAAFFLLAHTGPEAANDRAAETARIFLGMQIQCAQCHDHPFDQWKRVQFHELAGYFARLRERLVRENNRFVGIRLVSLRFGEHRMSDNNDPSKQLTTYPRFLDGKAPPRNLSDQARRAALASAIIDKNNYWFAAAFVNRMWGELMGQAFYQPVDEIGPLQNAVFPEMLTRLAAGFRTTNYDIKGLFRTVMNTQAYQRQIRLGESTGEHLHFAAAYPKQLPANALWDSLEKVLGPMGGPRRFVPRAAAAYGFRFGLEGEFKRLFAFDPSVKPDDVEGSIPQALILMNNPLINQRIRAEGSNLLARVLQEHSQDDAALQALYLQTLARKPTASELGKCRKYIDSVGKRDEAFEDILWALVNSTEFQTKR